MNPKETISSLTSPQREAFKRFRSALNWAAEAGGMSDADLAEFGIGGGDATKRLVKAEARSVAAIFRRGEQQAARERVNESALLLAKAHADALGTPKIESPRELADRIERS